ncbi:hypothetical protein EST38_g10903, partial [Candolleomyces aberdarensis]
MAKQQQQDTRLVAVMGETGAGKSSFINAVLGEEAALSSDGSFSCTRVVEQFGYKHKDGSTVTLVDTPGFNDYGAEDAKTDAEILQMIAEFLKTQYDEKRKFSGVVFLHPITAAPAGTTSKNMRMFKRLCGNDQLKNVVVVTTRWDEACYSGEGLEEAEQSEVSLMESEGLLKDLKVAGARFLRAGHFSKETPQPAGAQYQSPVAVVESLLGLEPVYLQIQEEMARGKPIQETAAGLVLEKEFENLRNTLNERMDNIQKTVEFLQSTTNIGKAEREKYNEILQRRVKEWEKLQGEFSTQWTAWEDCQKVRSRPSLDGMWALTHPPTTQSLIASQFDSFKTKQEQELENTRSEIREAQAKLNRQGLSMKQLNDELKQALETTRKERDVLSAECQTHWERERKLNDDLNETRSTLTRQTLDLQADKVKLLEALNEAKSALTAKTAEVEIMKREKPSANIPDLRAQLEEVVKDRDRVKASLATKTVELENMKERASLNASSLRAQLEDVKKDRDFTKAAQLDTQNELELTRKALQDSEDESEVLRQELDVKDQETDLLQKLVDKQALEIVSYTQEITTLEEEVIPPIGQSNVQQQQCFESVESSDIIGKIDNDEEGPDDGPANHIRAVKEPVSDHWSVSGQYHASILGPPGAYSDRHRRRDGMWKINRQSTFVFVSALAAGLILLPIQFINSVIGEDVAPVGDSILGTCTHQAKQYTYQLPNGQRVVFFDSPGFDGYFSGSPGAECSHKYPSNALILGTLDGLLRTQVPGARFSSVLLLHIQSNNEPAFPRKEKRLFTKLCGDDQSAIRVITTFWDCFSKDDYDSISAAEDRLAVSPPESWKAILNKQGIAHLRTGKALECEHIQGYLHPRQIIHQLLGVIDEPTPPQPEDRLRLKVEAPGNEYTMPDSPTTPMEECPPAKVESDDGGSGGQTAANTGNGIELGGIMGELQALRGAQRRELDHLRDYTAKLGHAASTLRLLDHPTFMADLALKTELKKKLEDVTKDHDHLSMKCEALTGQKEVLTEKLKRMTEMNDLVKKQQHISNSGSALADAIQPSTGPSTRALSSGIPLRSRREQLLDAIKSFSVQLSEELDA